MRRRPPRSTRTDTLFPYTTLFRSMSMAGMMDPKVVPPGWTYSPSTAAKRLPIVIMGVVGLLISRHLTAYQLGHLDTVWEHFFPGSAAEHRNGTADIHTSRTSNAWIIPVAWLSSAERHGRNTVASSEII